MTTETNIKITADYRIATTPHSWVVEKRISDKRWDIEKTYISLESLLHGFGDYLAKQDPKANIFKSFESANKVMREVISKNSQLILSLADDNKKPVIRASNTKLNFTTNGGN